MSNPHTTPTRQLGADCGTGHQQRPVRCDEIPRHQPVVIYCNTGSLSAQAGFALRLLGWENVRILQHGQPVPR